MAKYRAIPHGFLTVGQVAKKMGVTVRTLQYYDRVGVLSPSAESEGGRRLYTEKDFIRLHQILSLKSLGFSLEDIKQRLPSLEAPADVANALAEQAGEIRKEIERLTASLKAIEQLKTEVLQMQTVNFKKYADIIVNLQMKNDSYHLIKHFDDGMLDNIRIGLKIRISGWHESAFIFTLQFGCLVLEFQISFSVLMPLFDQTTVFQ